MSIKSKDGYVNGENTPNVPGGAGLQNTAQTPAVQAVEEASHLGVQQAVGRRVGGPVIAGSDRPLLGRLGSPGKTVAEQLVDEIREGISEWRPTEIVSAEKNAQWITGLVVELEPVVGNRQLVCRLSELISKRGPTKQMVAATPASCERYTYYLVGEISWLGNIVIQVAATFFMPPAAQIWFIAQFHSWCSAVLDLLEECEINLQQVEQDLLGIRQSIGTQIDLVIRALGSALVRGPKSSSLQGAFDDYLGGLRNSVRLFIESYHIAVGGQ